MYTLGCFQCAFCRIAFMHMAIYLRFCSSNIFGGRQNVHLGRASLGRASWTGRLARTRPYGRTTRPDAPVGGPSRLARPNTWAGRLARPNTWDGRLARTSLLGRGPTARATRRRPIPRLRSTLRSMFSDKRMAEVRIPVRFFAIVTSATLPYGIATSATRFVGIASSARPAVAEVPFSSEFSFSRPLQRARRRSEARDCAERQAAARPSEIRPLPLCLPIKCSGGW